MKKKKNPEISERQAERIIETYQNAVRNGEEWAHDVYLRRGTEKYEKSLDLLNEAFRIKYIDKLVLPLKLDPAVPARKRAR